MITEENKKEYYQAMIDKNTDYEGIFFVGVKTTGIFCRLACPARTPKFENCEFFETPQQALIASFRPCKRCRPLSHPDLVPKFVQILVDAVEENPEKRWKNKDFQELLEDASAACRQFKKQFGMTFVEYARARRMGLAMKQIRAGQTIIDPSSARISHKISDEGGRDVSDLPSTARDHCQIDKARAAQGKYEVTDCSDLLKVCGKYELKASWLETPLGPMIAIADEDALYLLEFADRRGLEREMERLIQKTKSTITPGHTRPIHSIENELKQYFEGTLREFKTPLCFLGSPFQKLVWEELIKIPAGETRSYSDIAAIIGRPSAHRAVARANGSNQLGIVVPCHRIVGVNGDLCGYGGGLARKKWLINHERDHFYDR